MFLAPTAWFWPAFGGFEHTHYPNYFTWGALTELSTPYEYLFFMLSAVSIAYVYGHKLMGVPDLFLVKKRNLTINLLIAAGSLLLCAGVVMLIRETSIENADYFLAGGICVAAAEVFRYVLPTSAPRRGRSAPPGR
jgi:hypothetical protein